MQYALIFFFSLLFAVGQVGAQSAYIVNPENVTIARDSFGVPHIFGKTDADVAYGLAWANSEDAFHVAQDLLYTSKGFMGRSGGVSGAKADFFVHAIGARQLVNERFESDLSPAFRKYLSGFTQGINAYAAAHPEDVRIKKAFPINEKDVLVAYVTIMSFMSTAGDKVGDAVSGKYDGEKVIFDSNNSLGTVGSNAFALAASKTTDGKTYLCINPHMFMEGQLSFYEAHLCSEEGLNISGPMFHGSSSLAMGVNKHLGWGMTWNYMKKADVFKLKMHPQKKYYYEFDGAWVKLEKRPVWLKVKVKGLQVAVKKTTYWSKYGATVKSDKGNNFYAIRFGANQTIKTPQQLYEMNKADSYESYWKALRNNALALFNIVYADEKNNIFYLSNGEIPDRNLKMDWHGIMPGNTSQNLWTKLLPNDSLPHVINPACGFVMNTNNTPFDATCEGQNDNPNRYPRYLVDERPGNNNRAIQLRKALLAKEKFDFSDLREIKFNYAISKESPLYRSLQPLFNLDTVMYPEFATAIRTLKSWNLVCDTNSYGTAVVGAFMQVLFDKRGRSDASFVSGFSITEDETVETLRKGLAFLKEKFGSELVRWGDIHVNYRAGKMVPMNGFPDVLSPTYPVQKVINGKTYLVPTHGDTYTMFAKFGNHGVEAMQSLLPTGNSLRETSPHYNDQIELFRDVRLKQMSLDKDIILKEAIKIYHPK
ncbi:MAG: penicillin acylase family protein [Chitinophagales bacterium]|nr:penicillin acylase family protein [Chitinophagales bacterium]